MRNLKKNFTDIVGNNPLVNGAGAGITLSKDGTSFSFDKTKFLDAYAKDPTSVQGLFTAKSATTETNVSIVADPRNPSMTAANSASTSPPRRQPPASPGRYRHGSSIRRRRSASGWGASPLRTRPASTRR